MADGIAVDDLSLSTVDTAPVQVFAGTTILGAYASIAEAKAAIAASEIAGDTLFIETTGSTDGFFHVVPGMSIQAALDASGDGDTIDIAAGSYAENLVVGTAVNLVGAQTSEGEPAVTIGTGAGTTLLVTADAASGTLDIANIAANGGAVGVSVATSAQLAGLTQASYDVTGPIGNVVLDGVHVTGDYDKPQLMV
ncbi:hypothetical protein [Novosphingobium decolorationis]|uniref:DUF1565 domain-containing protein n=1 Tax=Novosphingobium decolorationis TaxID=2698673 RepID=A0ABX8E803_9SPHN|nr:hypothetical protein [Novosphingobium decolorationis]QVM85302.1 hypothetical protein HT578_17815 [Novosphingobium decolorationis]